MEIELTKEEEKAIRRLQSLAKTWPSTLFLFAGGTGLSVRKPDGDNHFSETEVASIIGIPCSGGDGGD